MSPATSNTDLVTAQPPVAAELADELATFWETIFSASYRRFRPVLAGAEQEYNRNTLYLVREALQLAGTTQLTISCADHRLGGLGEVATADAYRGRGIAGKLSSEAREAFLALGGAALFLGTVNPNAARLYHRLGWRKLASANIMCLVATGSSPEQFLVDYFQDPVEVRVEPGTPACRVNMIPLIVSPHDERILDINVDLFSTRYAIQNSCMGLFRRYDTLRDEGNGEWFAAWTIDGRLVGLATTRHQGQCAMRIDGFAHRNAPGVLNELLLHCLRWSASQGARRCHAVAACDDQQKCAQFESLGFQHAGTGPSIQVDGNSVDTLRLERDVSTEVA